MRIYTLCFLGLVKNFVAHFISFGQHEFIINILVMFISQALYTVFDQQNQRIETDTEIFKGNLVQISFQILSYYYGNDWNENYEQAIETIIDSYKEEGK